MTEHRDDFEEFLRRALHATADSVEPSGDGLEQIRARLKTPRPLPVAWVMAACSGVFRWALGGLHQLRAGLRPVRDPSGERWRARPGTPGRRPAQGRLAAALVMAAFVVAAVALAGGPVLREASSLTGALLQSVEGAGTGGTGGPGANGQGNPLPASDTTPAPPTAGAGTGTAPSTGTTPSTGASGPPATGDRPTQQPTPGSPAGTAPASASPATGTSPPPTQSPTASATPTPDPSASPTPSCSPTPDPTASPSTTTSPSADGTATACPSPATSSSPASPSRAESEFP